MLFDFTPKIIFRIWSLSLFIFILLWVYPISYGIIRLRITILAIGISIGLVYLLKDKAVRTIVIIILLIFSTLFMLPGRGFNTVRISLKT